MGRRCGTGGARRLQQREVPRDGSSRHRGSGPVRGEQSRRRAADGDHKVAIQKCETLQGHDQSACKDQADADYDAAKAKAKAAKVASQP
jgi:hypothetical protein